MADVLIRCEGQGLVSWMPGRPGAAGQAILGEGGLDWKKWQG